MTMLSDGMLLGSGGISAPVIASFSQSSTAGGSSVAAASLTNMADGLFEPFAASASAVGTQYIRAHLAALAYVDSVVLGPSTAAGGWGSYYLNGSDLQYSNDNGATWNTVRTLSGYLTASSPTVGTMKTETIGALCTDIRVLNASGNYVALSEFKLAP